MRGLRIDWDRKAELCFEEEILFGCLVDFEEIREGGVGGEYGIVKVDANYIRAFLERGFKCSVGGV